MRQMTAVDSFLASLDLAVKACSGHSPAARRASPAEALPQAQLDGPAKREAGRLMRVNHCGEVCAQALYLGQALSSRRARTAEALRQAAKEEEDHLSWCQDRLQELDTPVSRLNPLFYAASFAAGYATGLLGDRISLGFLAATEEEVVKHLDGHLQKLPPEDHSSQAILQQMREDESQHRSSAVDHGALEFSRPMKRAMTLASRLMTRTTYWL